MLSESELQAARIEAIQATKAGVPAIPSNPFFGVGPITDATRDEVDSRLRPSCTTA